MMKKRTVFLTSALLVCIVTCVVFAFTTNHNRDRSWAYYDVAQPPNRVPGGISDKHCEGTDSEGPLYSTASSWFGYFRENGILHSGGSAYAYVSCYSSNANYKTLYDLYVEVPVLFQYPNVRDPDTQTEFGSFYDSESRGGSDDSMVHTLRNSNPNASVLARGTNPSNGDTHNTSAASPTPSTARNFEIICDACNDSGCDLCNRFR